MRERVGKEEKQYELRKARKIEEKERGWPGQGIKVNKIEKKERRS